MSAILAAAIAGCTAIVCPQASATLAVAVAPNIADAAVAPAHGAAAPAHAAAATADAAAAPTAHPRPARTRAANRAAAVSAALALLPRTPVPARARRLTAEPNGDGHLLARAPDGQVSRALIDRHAFYVVHEPLRQMERYYTRDRPAGARQIGTGSGTGPGVPANLNVTWQWHPGEPGIVSRQTLIDMVTLPTGATGIRIDAQVIYRVPRPAGEKVPVGVTEVDITRAPPGQMPDLSRTVTKPTQVHAIVALIDRLPIVQPDFIACPVELAGVPVVSFSFRASRTGPALAGASEPANVTEPTSACDALAFTTGTRSWPSLLRGARFLHQVDRLVHTRFAIATSISTG
jgi:hypothetical protein